MRFERMTIRNWRSFYGDHEIEFSTDPNRPVTLLLGPNGAGKTALLNTFTWVIYGKFTKGFLRENDLISHEALALAEDETTEVTLVFTDGGRRFTVRRVATKTQQDAGTSSLFVTVDGRAGTEEEVHRILPDALKDLFFFPAETFGTAEVLRSSDPKEPGGDLQIDRAIRTLLASDVYGNAVSDLKAATKVGALRSKGRVTDAALAQATVDFEDADKRLVEKERELGELPAQVEAALAAAVRAEAVAEQYDREKIRKWGEEHQRKIDAVNAAQKDVEKANELYVKLARHAYAHFVEKAVTAAVGRLDAAEQCGLIPPRIDGDILRRTLDEGRCLLCGEKLNDHAMGRVQELERSVADSRTAMRGLEARTSLRNHLSQNRTNLDGLRGDVAAFAARFENVGMPAPDADLVHLRATVHECIELADRYLGRAHNAKASFEKQEGPEQPSDDPFKKARIKRLKASDLQERLQELPGIVKGYERTRNDKLDAMHRKAKGSRAATDRAAAIKLLDEARIFFESALDGLTEYGRTDFEKAINQTYVELVRKPYELKVGDDFRISIFMRNTSQEVAPSQAENVLLLIAFLGAIARLAPVYLRIASQKKQFTEVGKVQTSAAEGFPVVIDSPVTPLDEEYELEVVKALPHLLPQIVVPVSAKSVATWETITGHVGSVYILELTSSEQSDRVVRWGGKDWVYSRRDDSVMTRTRIVRVG
ncbi:hypothetical protein CcI49_08820 [Frankia sp. CcI49]|uniref:AAA family ATPase n=1 Tax=Frankia sp. CcI49 TaxID=1745382 RepID=UPI000976C84E|nr:AAA family ATPase [Frankia sp. CcI49]ONH60710.1 hypothetical protein CcI49_08820 [Frankia sp. CcI49]